MAHFIALKFGFSQPSLRGGPELGSHNGLWPGA